MGSDTRDTTPCWNCTHFKQIIYCGYEWCGLFKDMKAKPCAYYEEERTTMTTAGGEMEMSNNKDEEI